MQLKPLCRALLASPPLSFSAKALGLAALAAAIPFALAVTLALRPPFLAGDAATAGLCAGAAAASLLALIALRVMLSGVAVAAAGVRANAALASIEAAKDAPRDEILRMIEESRAIGLRLDSVRHRLANRHPVTGIATREPLLATIARDAASETRSAALLGVVRFAQLERLMAVDRAGAEKALHAFGVRLTEALGGARPLAQVDRDSFAIWYCDETGPKGASEALQELALKLARPLGEGDAMVTPDVRVGAAIFPDDGLDGPTLLSRAVAAVGKAGRSSNDRMAFFSNESSADAEARHAMELALRQAIFRRELALYYQPVIDLTAGRVVGAEALLRWRHPEHGAIPPARFLPVLEQSGLIDEVGRWVLDAACRDARAFEGLGLAGFKVGVNLSERQFRDPELAAMVADALQRHELKPQRLELELTERSLMEDVSRTRETFEALNKIGVAVAIDDFGAGASSLGDLKSLPFSKLKIDRAFVTDVAEKHDSQAVCAALLELGRRLDIAVLAEGVETREEVEALRVLGCSLFQGFFFARPLPADKFIKKIADHEWQSLIATPAPRPLALAEERMAS
jgi:EAL domain-containing protein (putative c-di-GMP-specific phosphodiesterase class I)/GGDEF domain-containing protein